MPGRQVQGPGILPHNLQGNSAVQEYLFQLLICTWAKWTVYCRGTKTVIKLFPHQTSDLEPTIHLLLTLQNPQVTCLIFMTFSQESCLHYTTKTFQKLLCFDTMLDWDKKQWKTIYSTCSYKPAAVECSCAMFLHLALDNILQCMLLNVQGHLT